MCMYKVIESRTEEIEGIVYDSFGVEVYCENCNEYNKIADIPDVFLSRSRAEKFVDKCNKNALSPIYLLDEIEKELSE